LFGFHPERDDIDDVDAQVADRTIAKVDEGHHAGTALSLQGRVIPTDPVGRMSF
jgi:hypothetical protein